VKLGLELHEYNFVGEICIWYGCTKVGKPISNYNSQFYNGELGLS
jgi:hypothetical protein